MLAGQAVWGVEETASAMSGPVVHASVEITWADKYGCTKLTTMVAVGGLGRA